MTDDQYKHLLRGFPRMVRETVEGRATFIMFVALLVFMAFLVSRSSRLWAVAGAAIIGPAAVSLLLLVKPLNPYENLYASLEGKSSENAQKDPHALALIELLKSKLMKLYVVRIGLVIAVALSAIAIPIALAQGPIDVSFDRSLDLGWMFVDSLMLSLGCLGVEATLVLRHAVKLTRQRD